MTDPIAKKLIDFLKQLERALPPVGDSHHTLEYTRYGSDEKGWQDGLKLTVTYSLPPPDNYMLDGSVILEVSDSKKPTAALVSELVAHYRQQQMTLSTPQPSVPAGKCGGQCKCEPSPT